MGTSICFFFWTRAQTLCLSFFRNSLCFFGTHSTLPSFLFICGGSRPVTFSKLITIRYASFHDADNVYLIMEFVTGGDLFGYLRRFVILFIIFWQFFCSVGRFHPNMAKFYICEVILAIEYLQERNIAHRDIKPENRYVCWFLEFYWPPLVCILAVSSNTWHILWHTWHH